MIRWLVCRPGWFWEAMFYMALLGVARLYA